MGNKISFSCLDFPGGSDGKASAYNTGDQVQSLGQEDPTCHRATKSMRQTTEPIFCNYGSPGALEPMLHNKRSRCSEKPVYHNQRAAPTHHN